jgi:hypothetical protein
VVAFFVSPFRLKVAGGICVIWQQNNDAATWVAERWVAMSMPLHGVATLEFCEGHSPGAQKEPNIGAAITKSAPTTQVNFRQEARLCVSSDIRFVR